MDTFRHDLSYALRSLRKRPLFALVAITSLAVGVGANTAIFSVANTFFLQPIPGVEAMDRTVELGRTTGGRGFDSFSYPDFTDIREQVPALDEVAAWRMNQVSYSTGGEGERMMSMLVSANYFDALGVRPVVGRAFTAREDEGIGEHPVVVLDWRVWQDRFGGDRSVVGTRITLNRRPHTVVGVAPRDFGGHMLGLRPAFYVPFLQGPLLSDDVRKENFDNRRASWFQAIGRLAPGATVEQADAQARTLFRRLAEEYPDSNARRGVSVIPLGPIPGGGRGPMQGFLALLGGFVALVLLVTCANLAGMFLARSVAREKEIAVRLALGSGRTRLVRQLVTESLVVFLLGGAAGTALAFWAVSRVSLADLPTPVPLELNLRPDTLVLVFGLAVALVAGLASGLVPALQATRPDLVPVLKDDSGSGGSRRSRLRRFFVGAQVATSLVLLVGAALFLRSLQRADRVNAGFDPAGVYTASLNLSMEGYEREEGLAFIRRLTERLEGLPGAESAALSIDLPLDMGAHGTGVVPEGLEGADDPYVGVDFNYVSPGYFRTMRIPLLRGRAFEDRDGPEAPGVALVSRTAAREIWPDREPLGRRMRFGSTDGPWVTVVGVVEDVKNQMITDRPEPFVYLPLAQAYDPAVNVLVRAAGERARVAPLLRQAILAEDPSVSLGSVLSVAQVTGLGTLPQKIGAGLSTGLGVLALFLSGLGLYGVVAFLVAQGTREIGVRMALGASRRRVLFTVVRNALGLALPGLVVGGILALALAQGMRGFLLGVSPLDPPAYLAVVGALLVMILVAGLVPARRASRIHPMEALRYE